ncbi:retrovirus-related pol polyprotein from transposon TNT 1-94 [Tanacetum coccineum]
MVDNTLFTKKKSSNLIIVQIYVDDIIFGSTCQDMCDEVSKIMHDEFKMSMMGELNFFLGLQIKQMEDGIFFNQCKYIKEMLKKFGLEESKPMKTPMSSDTKLTKDEECESVDSTKYQGMIKAPKTSHLEAVKCIFRYIKGTTHLGLWYPKGTGIETIVYADSDHAGDYVDRKSTSGLSENDRGIVLIGFWREACYSVLFFSAGKVEESLNVTFDETHPPSKTSPLVDDDLDEEEAIKVTEKKNLENDIEDETLEIDEVVNIKESRNHPLENVIGNLNQRTLRLQAQNQSNFFCFISTIEPKNVNKALGDESWIVATQEELNQFVANDVWELVQQPRNMTIIGTKWVFRNKLDENGIVSRNKAFGTDKSKITRKQSKASKPGHENQKSTKPKPKSTSLSQSFSQFSSTRANLAISESYL